MKDHTDFNYLEPVKPFMMDIMKTVVQQDDFKGIGMHGLENHGTHGLHNQTSIGLGDSTLNFREIVPPFQARDLSFDPPPLPPSYIPPYEITPLPPPLHIHEVAQPPYMQPMPMYEPPPYIAGFTPPSQSDIDCPGVMNQAQRDFYGTPGIMNQAQQEFYGPPPPPFMDY